MAQTLQRVDAAIDRLLALVATRGITLPPPKGVEAALGDVRAAVAPLRLPREAERLWSRVDLTRLPTDLLLVPGPMPPQESLRVWLVNEGSRIYPRPLLPLAYESHHFASVELEDDSGHGGVVVAWSYGGGQYDVQFASVADYVEYSADTIAYRLDEAATGRRPSYSPVNDARRRLSAALPLPGFGRTTTFVDDARAWPEHWLLATGMTPASRALSISTTTIAELIARSASGAHVRGTVRAGVQRLSGSSDGHWLVIDDETGEISVWCPWGISLYGPSLRQEFEFDLIVEPHAKPPVDDISQHLRVQELALSGDIADALQAADAWLDEPRPAAATADAIRPVGWEYAPGRPADSD